MELSDSLLPAAVTVTVTVTVRMHAKCGADPRSLQAGANSQRPEVQYLSTSSCVVLFFAL